MARGELDAEFYRGSPFFRLYHTWTYTGDPWEDTLGGAGIRFRPEGPFWKEAAVDLDGEEVSSDSLVVVRQLDDEHAEAATSRLSRQGSRSTGTVRMRRKERDLIIHHRDFWRLFPKRIEASVEEGTVTFHYWPEDQGAMDWRPREDGMLTSSSAPHLGPGGRGLAHPRVHHRPRRVVRAAPVRAHLRRARGLRRAAPVPDGHPGR